MFSSEVIAEINLKNSALFFYPSGGGIRTLDLYYKHTRIMNYASSIVNKLEALLTDDARVVIYDRRVFIVQATDDVVLAISSRSLNLKVAKALKIRQANL